MVEVYTTTSAGMMNIKIIVF